MTLAQSMFFNEQRRVVCLLAGLVVCLLDAVPSPVRLLARLKQTFSVSLAYRSLVRPKSGPSFSYLTTFGRRAREFIGFQAISE